MITPLQVQRERPFTRSERRPVTARSPLHTGAGEPVDLGCSTAYFE
ncbi:hypothetical protein L838_2395 [Mycobacterium avium MAV_120709_2344]|nr:hypothetical protein L838_2395 [Mycobacterium avium MAV_120709_2344]